MGEKEQWEEVRISRSPLVAQSNGRRVGREQDRGRRMKKLRYDLVDRGRKNIFWLVTKLFRDEIGCENFLPEW